VRRPVALLVENNLAAGIGTRSQLNRLSFNHPQAMGRDDSRGTGRSVTGVAED
jgi:hypothetical protein